MTRLRRYLPVPSDVERTQVWIDHHPEPYLVRALHVRLCRRTGEVRPHRPTPQANPTCLRAAGLAIAALETGRIELEPVRGDHVDRWLEALLSHDEVYPPEAAGIEIALEDYRAHADAGCPLDLPVPGETAGEVAPLRRGRL